MNCKTVCWHLIFQHLVFYASLNHIDKWTVWYMIHTSGYDLEQCDLAWKQMSPDSPTSLSIMSLHVNSTGISLSPAFQYQLRSQYAHPYLTIWPMLSLVSDVWSKSPVEGTNTIFPGWDLNPVGFKQMVSKFLFPHKERKRNSVHPWHIFPLFTEWEDSFYWLSSVLSFETQSLLPHQSNSSIYFWLYPCAYSF